MLTKRTRPTRLLAFVIPLLLLAAPIIPASAINYGKGTYGSCQYGSCSLTISSGSSLSLNITPATGGSCSVQKDDVSVQTSNSSGFSLTLANASTNTALLKSGDSIPAASGTVASPSSLTATSWGFRVDNLGGFGAGPTTAQSNISIPSSKFAGVPASNGTAATIATTSTAANPAVVTSVWYGVCANTYATSGTYTSQVTYTAVAN